MAALKSLTATIEEHKGWLILGFAAYLLYCFRGVFSSLGDTASAAAEAATEKVKAAAQSSADKQKVAASGGATKPVTDAQAATFRADAISIAHMLGHDSLGVATFFKDRQSAFSLLKKSYSRLLLSNNHPYYIAKDAKGKKTYPTTTDETKNSAKRAVNWRVLIPFYKEATSGRDLLADLRSDLDIPEFRPYIKWII